MTRVSGYSAAVTLTSVSLAFIGDRADLLSNPSSEENGEPSLERDWAEPFTGAGQNAEDLALEVATVARARLVDIEVMLRDFWYDSINQTPLVAARISVAARLVHKAAESLTPQTLP